MKVVVVGSGAREHAFASALSRTADVVVTPGNPGIPSSVATPPEELEADLFVVGPEAPLVAGLADRLRDRGVAVFGPGADGARLEGSKAWMKQLLVDAGVPTARHGAFDTLEPAVAFLDTLSGTYVVKTDGLAAGKGVTVTADLEEARRTVAAFLSGEAFGDAGRSVVIEEGLIGDELSVFALCDGTRVVPCGWARDHKRVGDGDTGPNTGGMGAYSPVPEVSAGLVDRVMDEIIEPTVAALRRRGIDYRGVLYCGLMGPLDDLKVLEYNVRFGDPEAQVILPRVTSDLAEHLMAAAEGQLREAPTLDEGAAVTVVCATEGYPSAPRSGDAIVGIGAAQGIEGVEVFCAGVAAAPGATGKVDPHAIEDGALVTAGGRVLSVTGRGSDLTDARRGAYAAVEKISWPGMHHRTDIGADLT
ncbi:MAG: phosphoribosylamine--glycine ligase [Acidimicrobiia bacterium]|nr:phosphoribosylamine--glycine ligase [Acidimicrobiia bacterium]